MLSAVNNSKLKWRTQLQQWKGNERKNDWNVTFINFFITHCGRDMPIDLFHSVVRINILCGQRFRGLWHPRLLPCVVTFPWHATFPRAHALLIFQFNELQKERLILFLQNRRLGYKFSTFCSTAAAILARELAISSRHSHKSRVAGTVTKNLWKVQSSDALSLALA